MKSASIVARGRGANRYQCTWGEAFAAGLQRHGWKVHVGHDPRPADLLVLWGVRRVDWIGMQKAHRGEVCILERGYVGDRFAWASVSFGGGLNGRGRFVGPFEDGSRWDRHFSGLMKPWRDSGTGSVVVMGQVPTDNACRGVDIDRWCAEAREVFVARGFNVYIRPHPGVRQTVPIDKALETAAFVVTYNSNSAVDAVLAGVPAVAVDPGSMAWDVAGHNLTPPPTPDREAWARALAWKQWRLDEMASGYCWETVGRHVCG